METIIASVKQLAGNASETARRELIDQLRDLAYSLEESNDMIHRVGYLHLQTAAIKIGFDLKIFHTLSETADSKTVDEVAQSTGGRYLRYLASVGTIKETGKDSYAANKVTRNLTEKISEADISHCFETFGPQFQALPSWLAKNSYRNPSDPLNTVFQEAWSTDQSAFGWFTNRPANLGYFNDYMAFRRNGGESWLSVYPVEEEIKDSKETEPVVILQDMPHSIERALKTEGVENMEHNFFEPQPIKGAKFYFLRGVLHNHTDERVRLILSNIKSAMGSASAILADEMVLTETKVRPYATSMDLTMMAAMAARERTEGEWRNLFDSVGLKLEKTYIYKPANYEGVMKITVK